MAGIQTYHCICTTILLATTHTLSTLPRRTTQTGGLDHAYILPLPPLPQNPALQSTAPIPATPLPAEGYTLLLHLQPERKSPTIIRREDGFEKRVLYRCGRCRVVVGYEVLSPTSGSGSGGAVDGDKGRYKVGEGNLASEMKLDGEGIEGRVERRSYSGKVLYLLPGGVTSTDVMVNGGKDGTKIEIENLGISDIGGRRGVFE